MNERLARSVLDLPRHVPVERFLGDFPGTVDTNELEQIRKSAARFASKLSRKVFHLDPHECDGLANFYVDDSRPEVARGTVAVHPVE